MDLKALNILIQTHKFCIDSVSFWLCTGLSTFSVYGLAIQPFRDAEGVHQSSGSHASLAAFSGHPN